jgi:hypothetical protein
MADQHQRACGGGVDGLRDDWQQQDKQGDQGFGHGRSIAQKRAPAKRGIDRAAPEGVCGRELD